MHLDADPDVLRHAAERLTTLAGDLLAAAHRLSGPDPEPAPDPSWSGDRVGDAVRSVAEQVGRRRAHLTDGLRGDAAELHESARRLHEHRVALLAGESAAAESMTAVHRSW